MTTALSWLMEALQATPPKDATRPESVAIVVIRPNSDEDDQSGRVTGWNYQLTAPLEGVLNIRDDDQLRADRGLLSIVSDLLKENHTPPSARVCTFEFAYPRKTRYGCDHQPTSWKFTGLQNPCIDKVWEDGTGDSSTMLAQALQGLTGYLNSGQCQ